MTVSASTPGGTSPAYQASRETFTERGAFKIGVVSADTRRTWWLLSHHVNAKPGQEVPMTIRREGGKTDTVLLKLRIDTPIEVDYYRHGGILPFVLRQLLSR